MERHYSLYYITIGILIFCITGCYSDLDGLLTSKDLLSVDKELLEFSDKVNSQSLSIKANGLWSINNANDFLDFSQTSGSDDAIIDVSASDNPSATNSREGSFAIELNKICQIIKVKQTPKNYVFEVTPTEQLVFGPKDEKGQTVFIHTNTDWNVFHKYSWCKVTDVKGTGDKTITISCENNTTSEDRYDTLQIKTSYETRYVPIYQSGSTYYIVPSVPNLSFETGGGEKVVPIASNIDWIAQSLHSLCTPRRNGNDLSVSVEQNTTAEELKDTILLYVVDKPSVKGYVYVSQQGLEPKLAIKPDSLATKPLRFTNQGGEGTISIESNLKWSVKSSDESWCRVTSDKSGSGNGSVKISVDKNPLGASRRNATITIMTSALTKVVNIYQEPGEEPYINLIPATLETLNYENVGGTQSLKVESNIEWTVESDKTYWCHIESPSSAMTGNGEIRIRVDVNSAEASERNCNVFIKSSLGNKTIKVHQAKGDAGYVKTTPSNLEAKPQGGTVTFDIESNLSNWTVSSSKEWCKVQTASGSYNGTVSLSVELNSGTDARDATIMIKSVMSDVTVTVHQEPKDVPGDDDNPDPKYSRKM